MPSGIPKETKDTSGWTCLAKGTAISMYLEGKTLNEIAKRVKKKRSTVDSFITDTIRRLQDRRSKNTIQSGNQWNNRAKEVRLHNPALRDEDFLRLISEPDSKEFTQEEEDFIWHYTLTGDGYHSAISAKLDEGLFTRDKDGNKIIADYYEERVKLRDIALRMKPNVKAKLDSLKKEDLFQQTGVNREYLQRIILQQMNMLAGGKEVDKKLKREYVQMLGRTFGGFTERIEIQEVNHEKSLEALERAKPVSLIELKKKKEASGDGMVS